MNLRRLIVVFLAWWTAQGVLSPCAALEVKNLTTGITLFDSAGFEQDTVGTAPAVTLAGTWTAYPPRDIVVTGGTPGAFTGHHYLSTSRNATGTGSPRAFFASQEVEGHRIRMTFVLYVPPGADGALILENNATAYRALGRITGGFYHNYNGSAYINTGLAYAAGEWQRWEVEYTVGAQTYLVRIGANSITAPALDGLSKPGGGSVYAISFGHNGVETLYIDAAPPPLPPPPPNDDCADALPVGTQPLSGSTVAATSDGTASCGNSNWSGDIWYRYTAGFDGQIVIDTCGSDFDTVISVFNDQTCPASPGDEIACNDDCGDSSCGAPASCVTIPVTGGRPYLIRIAGANGAAGTAVIRVQELRQLAVDWRIGPDLPQGLQDSDGGVINNTLITVGGFCSGIPEDQAMKPGVYPRGFLRKAWGLDLADRGAGWTALPDFPGVARQGLFAAVVDDKIYLWGGFNYDPPYTYQDGYRLSRFQGRWIWEPVPSLPWRLTSAATAVIGSKIYVIGGADYDGETGFYTTTDRTGGNVGLGNHLLVLDTQDLSAGWRRLSDCPGTHRFVHAAAAVDGNVFVLGGATGGSPTCTVVDNWRYDPAGAEWTRLADLPISSGNFPRGSQLTYVGRFIVLPGGYQYSCVKRPDGTSGPPFGTPTSHPDQPYYYGVFYNDVFVYDTLLNAFGRTNLLPLNNNLPMTVIHGDEVFLIGGETGGALVYGAYYGHHPELCLTGRLTSLVPTPVGPDFDHDDDVDMTDFGHLQGCFTDPLVTLPPPECLDADLNKDGHVDIADFEIFTRCLSGPNVAAVKGCDDPVG